MKEPVIALRRRQGQLDDVVALNVKMFRAEVMDDKEFWLCCYFDDEMRADGKSNKRLSMWITIENDCLKFEATEIPNPYKDYDAIEKKDLKPEQA